jgi:hypothetical protein
MPVCCYMFKPEFDAIYNAMDEDLREMCDEITKLTGERYAVDSRTLRRERGDYGLFVGWKA